MPLLSLFVNSSYEVRSGWRFAAYCGLLVGLFMVTGMVLSMFVIWLDPVWLLMSQDDIRFLGLNAIVLFVPSMLALLLMARFDRVPVAAFGLALHERWSRDFSSGLALSGAMVVLWLAGAFLFGNIEIEWNAAAAIPAVGFTLAVLLVSALNEELVFRGYPLQVLMKGIGPWGAMLLLSSIFGLLHARNDGATALGVANTVLAGIFLSLAYMETRSLWLPYGIHAGWNIGTSVVLGLPVSGIQTESLLTTHATGPESWIGGNYGPEGGMLVTLLFAAGVLAIRRMRIGIVSPQLRDALAAHSDKVYIETS